MTNGEITVSAYRLLLGRDPEPEALTTSLRSLESGLSREEFIRSILASDEFRAKVDTVPIYPDVDVIVPLNGMRLCGPAADRLLIPTLLKERCWEPHITAYLRANFQPHHVFLDAGANIGYFTVLASSLVQTVISFEPVPQTAKYLEWNIYLNGLRNVRIFKCGLWCENATLQMAVDPLSLAGASIRSSGSEIQCVTLDSLIDQGTIEFAPHWVKMDIEVLNRWRWRAWHALRARTARDSLWKLTVQRWHRSANP